MKGVTKVIDELKEKTKADIMSSHNRNKNVEMNSFCPQTEDETYFPKQTGEMLGVPPGLSNLHISMRRAPGMLAVQHGTQ